MKNIAVGNDWAPSANLGISATKIILTVYYTRHW